LLSYANPKAQQRVVKRGGAGGGCGAHLTNTIFEIERQTFEQSTSAAAAAVRKFPMSFQRKECKFKCFF